MDLLWSLESIRTPFWNTFFGLITRLGEETILIVVFCVIFWSISKRTGYVIGISFFLSALLVQGMKAVFRVPRPWIYDPSFSPVDGSVTEATGYAFPSGHTQNAAAWLGALGSQIKQNIVKFTLFFLAILVAFSRLYLGVHYLSDVVVSLLISFAVIFLACKILPEEFAGRKKELVLPLIILSSAAIVVMIIIYLYHNEITEASQLRDAAIAAGAAFGFAVGMYIERVYIQFSVKARSTLFQIIKVVIGIVGVLVFQEGFRVLGSGLIGDGARYFLIVIWIMVIYPLVIRKFFSVQG